MRKIAVALLAALALLPGSAKASEGFPEQQPEFGYLFPGAHAFALTVGPDGNVWFAGSAVGFGPLVIGKVTPSGEVTEYPQHSPEGPRSITAGPDGNLWFTDWGGGAIERITPSGEVTSFPLPDPKRSGPTAITSGPDGNLWFTDGWASRIGRITPSGKITEFDLPPGRHPNSIATGADGNLWFTERSGDRIGRITTSGRVTEFPIPGPEAKPWEIVAGSDGNLWFTEESEPARIGRITPHGRITQFAIPTSGGTDALTAGPEGKIWFAAGKQIGAISTTGAISWPACLMRYCGESPAALAMGPEGSLWVSTGYRMCKGLCGGGSAIGLTLLPGGIGRYELPPVRLGIGPRTTPIRGGATSVLLVCGLPDGCRGQLRLTRPEWPHGHRRERLVGKEPYSLSQGEARRIPVPLLPWARKQLRETGPGGGYLAYAGPIGEVEARRGVFLS